MGSTRATEAVEKLTEPQSTKGMITVRRTYRGTEEIRALTLRGGSAWLVAGLLAIGLVFGLSPGPANAAPGGFSEEEVRFKSAGVTLEGTVLVPNGEGRKPAMALVHGAGPRTREDYYDPVSVLERVDQPVLALWGEKDRVQPPAESARILRQALQRGGNTLYTLRFFPNAEHGLHSSPDGFVIHRHLALGYPETVTSWVKDVARGEAPGPSAQAPPRRDHYSRPITPLAWWESGWVQLGAMVLPVLAFATYPAAALARPSLRRQHAAAQSSVQRVRRWARLLSGAGLVAVLGLVGYSNFLMSTSASAVGPVVLSRPLPWRLLQALVLTTGASILALAASWWSARKMVTGTERVRIGILLAGGMVFVAWAAYWGLLVP